MGSYVIYARKSTESDDRQVLSIDSQIREVRLIAQRHNVEVGEVLTESRSAKAPGRRVFGELIRRIHRGEIRGVLCWKMDRLARNPYDSGLVLQAQADGKLERIITSDGIKTADGNDRLMGTFELAFATKFIDDLRANVKRGNRARFEKGWPNHLPPIGYLNDKTTKTIVKDKERFPLVRRMWDALLAGSRPREIAQIANREWGFLTVRRGKIGGVPITYSSVYKLFTNPYYAGYIRLKDGRQYLGAHEPMVTPEEFERAQKILGIRAYAGPVRRENPYAGLIRCATCGCSIVVEVHNKGGKSYTYHRCGRVKPGVICREKPITQSALEEQLLAFCRSLTIPEPILAYLQRKLVAVDSAEAGMLAKVDAQRKRALTGLEREERELLGMRMRQLVSDAEFQSERESLRRRRQDLERSQADSASLDPAVETRKAEVSALLDLAHGVPFVLAQGDAVQVRGILQQLHLEITLRSRRLDFSTRKPLSQLLAAGATSSWCATWPEIWKWIQFGDQAEALGTTPDQLYLMMGGDERAVKMVERMRRRASGGQLEKPAEPPPQRKHFPTAERLDVALPSS